VVGGGTPTTRVTRTTSEILKARCGWWRNTNHTCNLFCLECRQHDPYFSIGFQSYAYERVVGGGTPTTGEQEPRVKILKARCGWWRNTNHTCNLFCLECRQHDPYFSIGFQSYAYEKVVGGGTPTTRVICFAWSAVSTTHISA
jgi:hypothetical protein